MTKVERNFGFKRASGVLMPVSCLPSPYGIGGFGRGAYDFIDFLYETKQTCWQVLPLCPTSYADSPYQSMATLAGNPYFIDPELLFRDGLLTKDECVGSRVGEGRIDYGRLFFERYPLLRLAYSRFSETEDYRSFCKRSASWIDDYALFMSMKVHYGYKEWTEWSPQHQNYEQAKKDKYRFTREMGFWRFLQYEFTKQWSAVREYAHSKGISVIGDMPIYVAHDSMDVWRAPEQFLLDGAFYPTRVAGCPPDDYAEDGQLWGNPIYNWERMRKDGFSWWLGRVKRSYELYDILRIDHFRGFASYYSVPYGAENARDGQWCEAPGEELFSKVKHKFRSAKIIAEDLGFITDDVRMLLKKTGFPGMKMLQFAFYTEKSEYLPKSFKSDNCVVYVSSHDSDLARSWYSSLDSEAKARFRKVCPRNNNESTVMSFLSLAMNSRAALSIVMLQDLLEMKNEQGRINVPSVAEGNWSFRFSPRYRTAKLKSRLLTLTEQSGRAAE